MIRAEIKHMLWSDGLGADLSTFRPEDHENFCCSLELLIGPHAGDGEESFQVSFCTPKWWAENRAEKYVMYEPHCLIVAEYNYLELIAWLSHFVEHCSGETWREVASQLSAISLWGFENYTL